MLILLSPAKALDFESPIPYLKTTWPRLLNESVQLVDVMRDKSVAELAKLSGISDELAALNAQRWADFSLPMKRSNARQALLAFDGDVYRQLGVRGRFQPRDFTESGKVLRILSGLYGLLRPFDLIQPYRLEMGTRLETVRGKNLYDWWGTLVTDLLAEDIPGSPGAPVVVNLASGEYSGVLQPERLGVRMISPRFEDVDARGRRSVVSFYAKRARGEMAYWLVRNRTYTPVVLPGFVGLGYRYDKAASTPDAPVYVRAFEDRPRPGA
ncbi:MAG TPA: peroxide stress protein YaaA [Propionicimonas sp.]|nr:peroxide stress protein YaaA [Propionicimonas sp.]HQA77965.1 peroxide stress protein YaaA [Propionicimonas sp.]HQD95849.1 peroxide stress protein YaaA [Propionicimonas sp.]